ncbi:MIZ/SP-RING zinc finger [Colletotrichum graminicola M1.001]|uniref:MIZ/SP-RING zinc finger n=1 Tax=Colletotrichum graminicola (strain M1.001 / M2 / FGSC 10212) TaxID=645133 RepID=E3QBK6_COLGM|nr:MIZ/SP-RING zinc finger [Colletotrichum graminicola M1.001]EFQ28345.1 MIZ/SP-RING zinc finger [Colletotrichum graminicola M1.001]
MDGDDPTLKTLTQRSPARHGTRIEQSRGVRGPRSPEATALQAPEPYINKHPPTAGSNQGSHRNPDSCVQSPDLGYNHSVNPWNAIPPPSGGAPIGDQPADACQRGSGLVSEPAVSGLNDTSLLSENSHTASRFIPFGSNQDPARCEPSNTPQDRPQNPVFVSQSVAPPSMPASATTGDSQRQSGQAVTSPLLNGQLAVPDHHPPRPPSQGNNDSLQTVGLPEANAHPEDSLRPKVMAENLNAFIRSLGGLDKLPDDGTSLPRVRLLKEAIETGDYFYIILHHVLCIWSTDGEAAYRLLGLAPDVAGNALSIIQNTLRKNENMTQELVRFFANFPNSWASGLWETEAFSKHVGDVSIFLNNLHEQWNRIHIPAMRPRSGRGYPILADELRYQLKLRSPLLENIFFTVMRRHIGVPDGPIADQMAALFRQDAENDRAKMSEREQRIFQHSLISRYKQLVYQNDQLQQQQLLLRQLRQQSNPSPAPGAQQPLSQNVAMPRQLNMPEQGRGSSTNFSPTQTTIASPTQVSFVPGSNMYPSPPVQNPHQYQGSFPGNIAQVSSQLRLRSNNPSLINSGIQPPMQQGPMRMPQMMMGQVNQAPTPAGSPHYANVQLPYTARLPPSVGQTSPVLQAPLGGLSISMPTVTSPTQSMTPQVLGVRSPGLPQNLQLPQTHSSNSQVFQRASNVNPDPRRQTAQQEYQHRHVQAIVQRQAANLASPQAQQVSSPRLQQAHQVQQVSRQGQSPTNAIGHPRMNPNAQGAITGAAPAAGNHQMSRPPAARSRTGYPIHPGNQKHWSGRYYQSIKKLAVGPVATPAEQALHRLVFVVPKEDIGKLCSHRILTRDGLPISEYFDGSLRYRLRLCELPVDPGDPTKIAESTWAVAQTYWPDHISILVNGKVMTIRRKQHNGQHQPVELTPFILAGMNSISVAISPPSRPLKPNRMYYMAVEIIETLGHENIIDMVLQHGVISADATREAIRKRLKPVTEDGDDELAVVDKDLSIDLADPFSATMFQIPVRGASCTHMECFDLATWLQTRPAKPKCTIHAAGDDCRLCNRGFGARPEPSLVDKWKCPLCDGDARPYSLRKDNFMAEVRSVLEEEGKLHTKTIYVGADGGWRAKVEEVGDEEDEEAEDEQPPTKRVKTRATPSEVANAVEVIELD